MIVQLHTPIPLETPRGRGMAHMVIDYGAEHSLIFVVFIDETGECWCYRQPDVRLQPNATFGREDKFRGILHGENLIEMSNYQTIS